MKIETIEYNYMCSQINSLKQRCRELSEENLFLKSSLADAKLANVLTAGGAL